MNSVNEDQACLRTVRDFVRLAMSRFCAAKLFFGHGTDNALDEAIALVLSALHLSHDVLEHFMDANLTEVERQRILTLIETRIEQKLPLPYITHEAWFAGLAFYIDQRALIPRSPIGGLIEERFRPWVDVDEVTSILDLCTGSGCIAIAAAMAFEHATVDAVDISQDALEVAAINVERHNMAQRIALIQSDLFANVASKYDVIITNPPYVDIDELANMPEEYRHEPVLALQAGGDGLSMIKPILRLAHHYLSATGVLVAEVGVSHHALTECFPNVPFTWLELAQGGEGVFLLTRQELEAIKWS